MSTADAILDAAEARIRVGGYHGFSFRDLAADVGIKSASVHHHFPTKDALGAAVTRRYARRFFDAVAPSRPGADRVAAYAEAFRASLGKTRAMCLCGILGAEAHGIPDSVRAAAHDFFADAVEHLAEGLTPDPAEARERAMAIIARLEGALILARALGDQAAFEGAVAGL